MIYPRAFKVHDHHVVTIDISIAIIMVIFIVIVILDPVNVLGGRHDCPFVRIGLNVHGIVGEVVLQFLSSAQCRRFLDSSSFEWDVEICNLQFIVGKIPTMTLVCLDDSDVRVIHVFSLWHSLWLANIWDWLLGSVCHTRFDGTDCNLEGHYSRVKLLLLFVFEKKNHGCAIFSHGHTVRQNHASSTTTG